METVPADGSSRSDESAEVWAVRIEQLHAEIERLQQPLPLAEMTERVGEDPMTVRGAESRRLDERIALLEQQREELRARIDELETECEALRRHVAAIEATRLMRWSKLPRRLYRGLRARLQTD